MNVTWLQESVVVILGGLTAWVIAFLIAAGFFISATIPILAVMRRMLRRSGRR